MYLVGLQWKIWEHAERSGSSVCWKVTSRSQTHTVSYMALVLAHYFHSPVIGVGVQAHEKTLGSSEACVVWPALTSSSERESESNSNSWAEIFKSKWHSTTPLAPFQPILFLLLSLHRREKICLDWIMKFLIPIDHGGLLDYRITGAESAVPFSPIACPVTISMLPSPLSCSPLLLC